MNKKILNHYLKFSAFTNPGCYKNFFQNLPDDVKSLGNLLSHQIIHRVTLEEGNAKANKDLRYGDMNKYPWHRLRCEDDIFPTAVSMTAELLRLDNHGFKKSRKVENKIVVTCRYVAILMASILKSKNIPCRVRSGFAPYFSENHEDHWINQYWDKKKQKWITLDADGFFDFLKFDQYNIPTENFDWSAKVWTGLRKGELKPKKYIFAGGENGLKASARMLMQDFHCLMNNEILYLQQPMYIDNKFNKLSKKELLELDELAKLMLDPDKNFDKLTKIWNTKKKFRILNSPLVGDSDHV